MLLIGLTGGSKKNIASVVEQVMAENINICSHWKLDDSMSGEQKMQFLTKVMRPSRNSSRVMVFTNVTTAAEADWFAKYHGYLWHVQGRFSDIPHKKPDHLFVCPGDGNKAPWLTVPEALSECVRLQDLANTNHPGRIADLKQAKQKKFYSSCEHG